MDLYGAGKPKRVVVKSYGRDSLLLWVNPLIASLLVSMGLRVGLRSDAEVLDRMEKDALAMGERGYRVAASDQFDLAVIGAPGGKASWYRVTYELAAPPPTR